MRQTHNAVNIGFDNRGEQAGIKMAPFTIAVIANRTGFTTGRRANRVFSAIPTVTVTEPAFSSRERDFTCHEQYKRRVIFRPLRRSMAIEHHYHVFSHHNKERTVYIQHYRSVLSINNFFNATMFSVNPNTQEWL